MNKRRGLNWCCIVGSAAALLVATGPAWGQAPLKVGQPYNIHVDSDGQVERAGLATIESDPTTTGRTFEIHHPGATYLHLHFKNFNLQPGEVLNVSDPNGGQAYTLAGRGRLEMGTFWAQHVKGDTIVLDLVTTGNGGPRFLIDKSSAGFVRAV